MKIVLTVIFFFGVNLLSYSQAVFNKDTAIAFTSGKLDLSYKPADRVSTISISANRFASGAPGMSFSFVTKQKSKAPNIRIDSIQLKSAAGKILTLNKPYQDTAYLRNDGGLFLMTIHWLEKSQLEMLKQETITTIILTVDKNPLLIRLNKKSQKQLQTLAQTNL